MHNGALRPEVVQAMEELPRRYPIHRFMQSPPATEFQSRRDWQANCEALVDRSDQVWVLMYKGWTMPYASPGDTDNTSKSVDAVLQYALKRGMPVSFVDPPLVG